MTTGVDIELMLILRDHPFWMRDQGGLGQVGAPAEQVYLSPAETSQETTLPLKVQVAGLAHTMYWPFGPSPTKESTLNAPNPTEEVEAIPVWSGSVPGVTETVVGEDGTVGGGVVPLRDTNLRPATWLPNLELNTLDLDPYAPSRNLATVPPRISPGSTTTPSFVQGVYKLGQERHTGGLSSSPLPGGLPVTIVPGMERATQFALGQAAWANVLISDYRSKVAHDLIFSTRLADVQESGELDFGRIATLSAALRVVKTPRASTYGVAWNGGYAPHDPKLGRGQMTSDGWLPSAQVSFPPGAAGNPQAITYVSASGGGPLSAGDGKGDKHAVGTDADGVTHVGGHHDLRSPWYLPGGFDAPPEHRGFYDPFVNKAGVWTETVLRYDPEDEHRGVGSEFVERNHLGLHKWQTRVLSILPPIVDLPKPKPDDALPPPLFPPPAGGRPETGTGTVNVLPQPGEFRPGIPIPIYPTPRPEVINDAALESINTYVRHWLPQSVTQLLLTPQPFYGDDYQYAREPTPDQIRSALTAPPSAVLVPFGTQKGEGIQAGASAESGSPWATGYTAGGVALYPPNRHLDPRFTVRDACVPTHFALYNDSAGLCTFLSFGVPAQSRELGVGAGTVLDGFAIGKDGNALTIWATSATDGSRELELFDVNRDGYVEFVSQAHKRTFETTNFTAVVGRTHYVDSSGGAIDATLPSAAGVAGHRITFKDIGNAGTNAIFLVGTVDGATDPSINDDFGSVTIESNGTSWFSVAGQGFTTFGSDAFVQASYDNTSSPLDLGTALTAGTNYTIHLAASSGNLTVTLPNPSTFTGKTLTITCFTAATRTITINGSILGANDESTIQVPASSLIGFTIQPSPSSSSFWTIVGANNFNGGKTIFQNAGNIIELTAPANDATITWPASSGTLALTSQLYSSPLTTTGDIMYRFGGVDTRLGIGTLNQVLRSNSSAPIWTSVSELLDNTISSVRGRIPVRNAAGWESTGSSTTNQILRFDGTDTRFANLTTVLDGVIGSTRGQIAKRGASAWEALSVGAANTILRSDGTDPGYSTLTSLLDGVFGTARGQIIRRGASNWETIGAGGVGEILRTDGTDPGWATLTTVFNSLLTTRGQLLSKGASLLSAINLGAPGTVLRSDGTDPGWATVTTILDSLGTTRGSLLYRGDSAWLPVVPSTAGYVLTDGGVGADPSWAAPTTGDGAWIELGAVDVVSASPAATADFSDLLSNDYGTYVLIGENVLPATDNVAANIRTALKASPTTYITSGYMWAHTYGSSSGVGGGGSNSDSAMSLGGTIGNQNDEGLNFELTFNRPISTIDSGNGTLMFSGTGNHRNNSGAQYALTNAGSYDVNAAITGSLRFYFSSGNITRGRFRLYGIKGS